MDLISRQAAIDNLLSINEVVPKNKLIDKNDAVKMLVRLPSAQPEIIKCRDCKYWDQTWQSSCGPGYYYCIMIDMVTNGDFYCADAERRTDE